MAKIFSNFGAALKHRIKTGEPTSTFDSIKAFDDAIILRLQRPLAVLLKMPERV
jgi:hypothetical protein